MEEQIQQKNVGTEMVNETNELLFMDPDIEVKVNDEELFGNYLHTLNEYQKLQLYKQQLEQAMSLTS